MKYSIVLASLAVSAYAAALPADPTNNELAEINASQVGGGDANKVMQTPTTTTTPGSTTTTTTTPATTTTTQSGASTTTQPPTTTTEKTRPPKGGPDHPGEGPKGGDKDHHGDKDNSYGNGYDDKKNNYDDNNDYDYENKHGKDYDNGSDYGKSNDYGKYSSGYGKEYDDEVYKYDQTYFKAVDYQCYEDKRKEPGYKTYKPEPPSYDEDKSYYSGFKFPKYVHKEKGCTIEWNPKKDHDWKSYKTKIYLVDCDDYEKPRKVCDECGDGKYDWHVPSDCEPSDDKKPKWYRFKFVKYDEDDSCTYSEEFPIYKKEYDTKPENDECPPPKCEECGAAPVPPAKKPESAPADSSDSAKSPVEAAPSYGNETAVYTGAASSAVRASLSVIVGVAALVTFAL